MSATVKTSACVDCATPIIGDQLRCPACHADHAAAQASSSGRIFLSWLLFAEILAMAICGLVLVARGCAS